MFLCKAITRQWFSLAHLLQFFARFNQNGANFSGWNRAKPGDKEAV
jgi:hypothetical protein